jgi:deoxyribodipyrimidine photolyase
MGFRKNDNSIFWDVLTALALSVNSRLRWKEIRDVVHKRYEKTYDKETFEVLLNRVLKRLFQLGHIKKDSKGHQEVYYFIPKQRQKEIIDELNRRFVHKKLDEIWERLSSEQRKRAVENLMHYQALQIQAERHLVKTFVGGLKELGEVYLSDLNSPQEVSKRELSAEEKQELARQLAVLQNDCIKVESAMAKEESTLREKFNEYLELSMEFLNKVVDPLYGGDNFKAIADLMRKAVEEQNKKNSAEDKNSKG